MTHRLVTQLRFARSEFLRALQGLSEDDGCRRLEPMNSISWIIGHLAHQENQYWVLWAQGKELVPELGQRVGWGQPPSCPPLDEMWGVWRTITRTADVYLSSLTAEVLQTHLERVGGRREESVGTMLLRNTYHYWFHLGEAHAVRQMLGHGELPQFVGDMSDAVYRPDPPA